MKSKKRGRKPILIAEAHKHECLVEPRLAAEIMKASARSKVTFDDAVAAVGATNLTNFLLANRYQLDRGTVTSLIDALMEAEELDVCFDRCGRCFGTHVFLELDDGPPTRPCQLAEVRS